MKRQKVAFWRVFPSMQSSKKELNWADAILAEVKLESEAESDSPGPQIFDPLGPRVKRAPAPGWRRSRQACKIYFFVTP